MTTFTVTNTPMNVQTKPESRKRAFRAALALAGVTFTGWAKEQGVSRNHLDLVLKGERDAGAPLDEAIALFIAQYLPDQAA